MSHTYYFSTDINKYSCELKKRKKKRKTDDSRKLPMLRLQIFSSAPNHTMQCVKLVQIKPVKNQYRKSMKN